MQYTRAHNKSCTYTHIKLGERKKKQSWRGPFVHRAKKSRRAVICPLIVIYCDPRATRADGRTFACEIGDGIRAWISSRMAGRVSRTRAENGACLTQLDVERWSGIGRLSVLARWHVSFIPHHVRGRSAARVSEWTSERASSLRKKNAWFPPRLPPHSPPFCTSLAARNAANWTCQSRWNIDRGPVRVPAVESEIPRRPILQESRLCGRKSIQARLNSTVIFIRPTVFTLISTCFLDNAEWILSH